MTNKEKYDGIFREILGLEKSKLDSNLLYQSVPAWDSVGHMSLISIIEETFNIMMDTDDIIDFNSYQRGMEILEKYDIKF